MPQIVHIFFLALLLFVSNFEPVYFDDWHITLTENPKPEIVQEVAYDPWGLVMQDESYSKDPANENKFTFLQKELMTYADLNLYHFQYRNYDAQLGRWHNVDAFADKYSSFSSYHFSGNNPVMNKEHDGRFFWTAITGVIDGLVTGFFKGGFDPTSASARSSAWKEYDPTARWSKTNKAWEIDKGLVQTDPNKSFWGQAWELFSRFTWQAPQTVLGNAYGHILNNVGVVNNVSHGFGVTVLDTEINGGAITIGNYISGPRGFRADWTDHLFVHEYGHYIQSQQWGPAYLLAIGVPSLQSAGLAGIGIGDHHDRWFEADASFKGMAYFDEHFGSGAAGYFRGSLNHFDSNSFINANAVTGANWSPYNNNRTGVQNFSGHAISPTFHWSDPFLYAYLLAGFFIF